MKLKQNFPNTFNCVIIINGTDYLNQQIIIDFFISSNKKYYYKIICPNCLEEQNIFTQDYIEGVKGFGQHIISGDKYHMVFKEKSNQLELITWDNSIFINGSVVSV